jgi:toxin ParE1/3/4
MQIKWLRLALNDFDQMLEYISKDNKTAALKIAKIIIKKIQYLTDHPNIGRPGRVAGTRELYISGTPFVIPYRIVNNEIQILRVMHGSRNWPDEF